MRTVLIVLLSPILDDPSGSAALDRLLHRATVINIRGESFRLKERKRADSPETPGTKPGQRSRAAATEPEKEVSA